MKHVYMETMNSYAVRLGTILDPIPFVVVPIIRVRRTFKSSCVRVWSIQENLPLYVSLSISLNNPKRNYPIKIRSHVWLYLHLLARMINTVIMVFRCVFGCTVPNISLLQPAIVPLVSMVICVNIKIN